MTIEEISVFMYSFVSIKRINKSSVSDGAVIFDSPCYATLTTHSTSNKGIKSNTKQIFSNWLYYDNIQCGFYAHNKHEFDNTIEI